MVRLTFREWSLRSAIRACVYVGPGSVALLRKLLLLHNRVSKKQQRTGRAYVPLRTYVVSADDLRILKEGLDSIPDEERLPSDRRLLYNVDLRLNAIEAGEDLRTAVLRDRRNRRQAKQETGETGDWHGCTVGRATLYVSLTGVAEDGQGTGWPRNDERAGFVRPRSVVEKALLEQQRSWSWNGTEVLNGVVVVD